jgi:hypothetical protein
MLLLLLSTFLCRHYAFPYLYLVVILVSSACCLVVESRNRLDVFRTRWTA